MKVWDFRVKSLGFRVKSVWSSKGVGKPSLCKALREEASLDRFGPFQDLAFTQTRNPKP